MKYDCISDPFFCISSRSAVVESSFFIDVSVKAVTELRARKIVEAGLVVASFSVLYVPFSSFMR